MTVFGEYEAPPSPNVDDERDFFDVRPLEWQGVSVEINGKFKFEMTANQARLLALELFRIADHSDALEMETVSTFSSEGK